MRALGLFIRKYPRAAAAIAFGLLTTAVTHFAWFPGTRMTGLVPKLTIVVGIVHAVAGALTGRSLIDRSRTRNSFQACMLGGATSLIAIAILVPPFAVWVSATNAGHQTALSFIGLIVWIGVFSFLAIGWAHLLTSIVVGWGIYHLANAWPDTSQSRQHSSN